MPIATALIVAAAAYQAQRQASSGDDKNDGEGSEEGGSGSPPNITPDFLENKTSIELLPLEQSLTMLEWPIATVSFYKCASADAMDIALEKLTRRVPAVLRANPWLGGWLVRGKGVGSFDKTPRLWFNPAGENMAPGIFQILPHDDVPIDKDTPYTEYESILSEHAVLVKTNPEIENRKEEPLFRLTVIPSPDNNEFALVQGMSHVLGDAHTFYRINNMILGSEPIVPLKPQRELLYSQKVMDLMGKQEAHYISHITTDPAWMKLFRHSSTVEEEEQNSEANKLHGRVFLVNRHWVGNIKAAHMTNGNIMDVTTSTLRSPMTPQSLSDSLEGSRQNPIQSTNDILVSFFWNLVNPDVGLMTVNFRKRLDIVNEDNAGNYANPIPYTRGDYKEPALIRKSLETCRRAGTVGGVYVPSTLPRANPGLAFSIITNWSSFRPAGDDSGGDATKELDGKDEGDWINSPDVKLIRHLPIFNPKQMIERMPKRMSFLVIFSSGPEDLGCVLIAPGRVMEEIDLCGVVEKKISEF